MRTTVVSLAVITWLTSCRFYEQFRCGQLPEGAESGIQQCDGPLEICVCETGGCAAPDPGSMDAGCPLLPGLPTGYRYLDNTTLNVASSYDSFGGPHHGECVVPQYPTWIIPAGNTSLTCGSWPLLGDAGAQAWPVPDGGSIADGASVSPAADVGVAPDAGAGSADTGNPDCAVTGDGGAP